MPPGGFRKVFSGTSPEVSAKMSLFEIGFDNWITIVQAERPGPDSLRLMCIEVTEIGAMTYSLYSNHFSTLLTSNG